MLGFHVKELVCGGSIRIFKCVTVSKINQMSFYSVPSEMTTCPELPETVPFTPVFLV